MIHKQERRKHVRLPILHGILEPVEIEFFQTNQTNVKRPAILSDLSAGGMRIIIFYEPPHTKELNMVLNLNKEVISVKGKIAWLKKKGDVYMVGIVFTSISKDDAAKINEMAVDYLDCDIRISFKLPDVCNEKCKAHILCNKPQKCEEYFKD
ncbi:MAG: PilZ domain-containing protein [Elusimicrobiales bacterium]